jgi:hypothetical protein
MSAHALVVCVVTNDIDLAAVHKRQAPGNRDVAVEVAVASEGKPRRGVALGSHVAFACVTVVL